MLPELITILRLKENFNIKKMIEDPNWFYSSMAQSAAAIVGLIGAFVTSRVIMMGSERNQIENRINEINAEIKELEQQNEYFLDYTNRIDEESRIDDEITVDTFFKEYSEDLENLPTEDDMLKELLEGKNIKIEDEKFKSYFKEKYTAWIEEVRKKTEQERTLNKLVGKFSSYIPLSIFSPLVSTFDNLYSNYKKKINENITEINYKKVILKELERQLNQIILPKHFKLLIYSLIFFSIVGVIIPLWLLPISYEQHLFWKPYVMFSFMVGLSTVFILILIEIQYITKKAIQK